MSTPEPSPSEQPTPSATPKPSPTLSYSAPAPVATPENRSAPTTQEATLPQTGLNIEPIPLTIFAVFLVLMAGGFFVADYRKRKANGEHVDAD